MKISFTALALAASALFTPHTALAQTEIQWWHSMSGALGDWVGDIANDFNGKQKEYKIVPVFKGNYDESMTAAVAAFRAGNAPHIFQVFEVGTATMMASKGVVVPVEKIMRDAGYKFDPKSYVPAVSGYYTAPNGQMMSFPFNSSTTVMWFNVDALKAAMQSLLPSEAPESSGAASEAGPSAALFESLLGQLFAHQYPAHPEFDTEIKPSVIKKVWPEVQKAIEAPGQRG
jgi:sn-glycerol 3-phosphate transport system substrate-binding protein